jgi:Acetyltransferase (GNAT) domain
MDSPEPAFIVVGEKVSLGPLRRDLVAAHARWMNQLEVRRGLDYLGIATPQSQEKWAEENIERGAKREPEAVEFTVYDGTDSTAVGTAGLFQIAYAHGTAEFAIAIGERRGQGLGTEARGSCSTPHSTCCCAMCGPRRWSGGNDAGLTAYERADLRRVGVRRGDESGPADGRRDQGRGPGGLRRVGAARSSQRAPKLDTSSASPRLPRLPRPARPASGDRFGKIAMPSLRQKGHSCDRATWRRGAALSRVSRGGGPSRGEDD